LSEAALLHQFKFELSLR